MSKGVAALGAVFAVTLAGTAVAIGDSWGGRYWQFDCAVGVVVSGAALVRRRARLRATAVGLAVAAVAVAVAWIAALPHEPGPATVLGLAVLVGSVVRTLPARPAGAVAAGGFAVAASSWLTSRPSPFEVTPVPVLAGMGWLAALAVGLGLRVLDIRRRAMVDGVRREERLDLARELHDVAAHHITGIVVQAQAAQLVARKHPERLDSALAGIEAAGSDALAAMRRVVGLLRDADDAAPAAPGPERLSELVARFDGAVPVVQLRLPAEESAWPPEVTSTVYRIVQEALTNVVRHASHASTVAVTVEEDLRDVTVEIVDDAAPAPARYHREGYGLIGMRERVETLGGTLSAGPLPEVGWSVRARVPR